MSIEKYQSENNRLWGLKYNGVIIEPKFDEVWILDDNIAKVLKQGKYGLFNADDKSKMKNSTCVSCFYDDIGVLEEGFIAVCENGKWGFVNKKFNPIIQAKYEYVNCFSNGLAAVYDGKFWGYIDYNGDEVIPLIYKYVGNFDDEGYAEVTKGDGSSVIIDKNSIKKTINS